MKKKAETKKPSKKQGKSAGGGRVAITPAQFSGKGK